MMSMTPNFPSHIDRSLGFGNFEYNQDKSFLASTRVCYSHVCMKINYRINWIAFNWSYGTVIREIKDKFEQQVNVNCDLSQKLLKTQ